MEEDLRALPLDLLLARCRTGEVAPFVELRRRAREGSREERLAAIEAAPGLAACQPVGPALADAYLAGDAETRRAAIRSGRRIPSDAEAEFEDLSARWLEEFVAWGASGRPEGWGEDACWVAEFLLRYRVEHDDGWIGGWKPRHAREFLLRHFPRKGSCEEDFLDSVPRLLRDWFAFLEASGRLEPAARAEIDRTIEASTADFLRDAREPANFGPAKTLVTGMIRDGVDLLDARAREAWIARHNASVADESDERIVFLSPGSPPPGDRRARERREKRLRKAAERARRRNRRG